MQADGAVLHTELLTKLFLAPLSTVRFIPPIVFTRPATPAAKQLQKDAKSQPSDAEKQVDKEEQAFFRTPPMRIATEETTRPMTLEQLQHFQALLHQSNFWQMASCEPSFMLDGAQWLLEAHQVNGYHAVLRQSPQKGDAFRAACEYLLDLSSARKEERY